MATYKKLSQAIAAGALLLLCACAGRPREPAFASVALPPVPTDKARIFFYRFYEPYESLSLSAIYLNRREAAVSVPGEVSKLDVLPGNYEIYVYSRNDFLDPFKHVALRPGDTLYVRVDAIRNWSGDCFAEWPAFTARLIPPEEARAEMAQLRYGGDHGS
ncbi:MAG TPA: hypothetical protein VGU20_12715 [Stellaceae bacterium]|nr:hypothetical protein [Stellaceae bacterium]